MSPTWPRVLSDRIVLGVAALALGACSVGDNVPDWTPEREVEGTFEGLSNDCRCFGHPPTFSLSCAGSQIEIDGVEQRMVFDIELFQTIANTRSSGLTIQAYVGDFRGYVGIDRDGAGVWWGSQLFADPRAMHTEQYRVLGIDRLFGPQQAFYREGESFGIERGPFSLTDVRVWCEDRP